MDLESNVKVAVRIRPQVSKELIELCSVCTSVTPNEPQIWLGKDKAFTFDYVFDLDSNQNVIYDNCVSNLIEGCLEGYNATIVAYGQTGSGKTYTMGTSFGVVGNPDEKGIIPRAVDHLFEGISKRQEQAKNNGLPVPEFKISVQFLELYNEEIIDLLSDECNKSFQIKIHEDALGGIYTVGTTAINVKSSESTMQCLQKGALCRQTGSTNMNAQSSRSHAIFTLFVKQQRVVSVENNMLEGAEIDIKNQEFETLTAKFHFVDLAGSERLKRTGATGDRAKEGISINSGLLSLGNVISALGDKNKRVLHVPYRDSKLTRLLQDSLGGNSRTLMIACISPSDRDFMETLSTLRYANRAKNIKNKVVANQDKSSQTISLLRKQIQQLELELHEYRQGKRILNEDGTVQINDMYHENTLLQTEINNLKIRIKALQDTNDRLIARNADLITEKELSHYINSGDSKEITELVKNYVAQIEELRAKLIELEQICSELRKKNQKQSDKLSMMPYVNNISLHNNFEINSDFDAGEILLDEARKDVENLKRLKNAYRKESQFKYYENDNLEIDNCENNNSHENGNRNSDENESGEDHDLNEFSNEESEEENDNSPEQQLESLSNEISVKERLICEIEKNKKKLDLMKQNYEDKLKMLKDKIMQIEVERDQVMNKLLAETEKTLNVEKVDKIRKDYEKQLTELRDQVRKTQSVLKNHNNSDVLRLERQMNQLKNCVNDLKKQKVKLLQRLKEEAQKHRQIDLKNTKKIIQLTKQERVKDVKIKNLEGDCNRFKILLKRKDDEVSRLKNRSLKSINNKIAGRVSSKHNTTFNFNQTLQNSNLNRFHSDATSFSPKKAKEKWNSLESNISKLVLQRKRITEQENQMERVLLHREELSQLLDMANKKLENALKNNQSESYIRELHEEIDSYEDNIKFLNQKLNDHQSLIMEIEEQKEELEHIDLNKFICKATFDELSYIFEKLYSFSVNRAVLVSQKEEELKKSKLKYKQVEDCSLIQDQFLHQVLESTFLTDKSEMDIVVNEPQNSNSNENNDNIKTNGFTENQKEHKSINKTFKTPLPIVSIKEEPEETNHLANVEKHIARLEQQQQQNHNQQYKNDLDSYSNYFSKERRNEDSLAKSRRLTSTTNELFYATLIDYKENNNQDEDSMTQSMINTTSAISNHNRGANIEIKRAPSAPSLKDMMSRPKVPISPTIKRKHEKSIENSRKTGNHSNGNLNNFSNDFNNLQSSINRQNNMDLCESTPPASPLVSRRYLRDENVFNRLTNSTNLQTYSDSGIIVPFTGKTSYGKNSYLVCSHIAEGHSRPVLSVAATNDIILTGSKDCSLKVWDLNTGKEIQSLRDHPDSVICVRYNDYNRLAFTVSKCYIFIWDIRCHPYKYQRTICSNGLWDPSNKTSDATHSDPKIFDIQLSTSNNTLYSTCLQIVRFWDLRMFYSIGKLNPNHQSNVTCIEVGNTLDNQNLVITGSKDHYMKIFTHAEETSSGLILPQHTLDPPHCDGIEALTLNYPTLFSASRDGCIKKWNIAKPKLIANVNLAHKESIQALSLIENGNDINNSDLLISGCKGGILKLWDSENCKLISEFKAHSGGINSLDYNNNFIFTGSSDNSVAFWRKRSSFEPSPDSLTSELIGGNSS